MNSGSNLLYVAIICGIIAVLYGIITSRQVLGMSAGNQRMVEVSKAIQEGAGAGDEALGMRPADASHGAHREVEASGLSHATHGGAVIGRDRARHVGHAAARCRPSSRAR